MKNYFLIFLWSVSFFFNSCKNYEEKVTFWFADFPLDVPRKNSLIAQWEKKSVLDSRLIDDMESGTGWKVRGIGVISYTQDRAKLGRQSLRFPTSLRDSAAIAQRPIEWGSFDGRNIGASSVAMSFDTPQDWSSFNRISFWVYVHPTSMLTYCLSLSIGNLGYIPSHITPKRSHVIQDLKPGVWNNVLFEMPHLERDRVTNFTISQSLTGHHPEEEGIVTFDIDFLELQRVEPDQYEGWTVAPKKFAFNHIGYRPGDRKIAMVGSGYGKDFQLIDQKDRVVFSGHVGVVENKNGKFQELDFSDFQVEGLYRIRCGSLESNPFPINENIWVQPVFKAINFFFCERCGIDVPGVHLACHKDVQGIHGDVKKVINGGWHDAGDLSQGYWRTAMAAFAMMLNLEVFQEREELSELSGRIREELAWGLDWLLKVRFGDGFHVSWTKIAIYTDNKIGTVDDILSPARNVPWENFLAAAVLGKAAVMLENSHP